MRGLPRARVHNQVQDASVTDTRFELRRSVIVFICCVVSMFLGSFRLSIIISLRCTRLNEGSKVTKGTPKGRRRKGSTNGIFPKVSTWKKRWYYNTYYVSTSTCGARFLAYGTDSVIELAENKPSGVVPIEIRDVLSSRRSLYVIVYLTIVTAHHLSSPDANDLLSR